jgi:hypothetical protein
MEEKQEIKKIEINQGILRNLNTIRKWTMFLSIAGFISLGVVVVFGILTGTFLSVFSTDGKGAGFREMAGVLGILGMTLIYMFPILFLFGFSKHAAKAAHHDDQVELNKAFKSLKYFFASLGIFTIILLIVYIASLIFAGASMTILNGPE